MHRVVALILAPKHEDALRSIALLILRVGAGGSMLFGHGLRKLSSFSTLSEKFSDPLGVGSTASLTMAVFGEVVCSALLIAGLATRVAAVPFLVTMLVAAFVVHDDDPWAKKELALLYAIPALTLALAGGGRFSADGWLLTRRAGTPR